MRSPALLPSQGSSLPSPSTIFMSMPGMTRPCLAFIAPQRRGIGMAMLLLGLRERADRAHLGHAPGMHDLDAVFILEAVDHRRRAGRAADDEPLQGREAQLALGHVVQQPEPHRRHAGAHRHLFALEELVEAFAVERGAGQHELRADQHRRIRQAPGIHMEHRHDRADHVARREIEAIGQRRAVGMQHRRAMLIERAFGIAGRARGVAKRRGQPLIEDRPDEIVALGCDEILVAKRCPRAPAPSPRDRRARSNASRKDKAA